MFRVELESGFAAITRTTRPGGQNKTGATPLSETPNTKRQTRTRNCRPGEGNLWMHCATLGRIVTRPPETGRSPPAARRSVGAVWSIPEPFHQPCCCGPGRSAVRQVPVASPQAGMSCRPWRQPVRSTTMVQNPDASQDSCRHRSITPVFWLKQHCGSPQLAGTQCSQNQCHTNIPPSPQSSSIVLRSNA